MSDWLDLAQRELAAGCAGALITVTRTFGSTPREVGACMWIGRDGSDGTIGGGKLELDATSCARALLAVPGPAELALVRTYNLGPGLGQCCGGRVEMLIQRFDLGARAFVAELLALRARGERYVCVTSLAADSEPARVERTIVKRRGELRADAPNRDDDREHARDTPKIVQAALRLLGSNDAPVGPRWHEDGRVWLEPTPDRGWPVVLFGAGHVGRALVHVIAPLGWPITWVETRDDAFPGLIPAGVSAHATDVPESFVDEAAPGSAIVIMTHDHALDYRLCERVLTRNSAGFCGLIGSRTKRAKFAQRLAARGFDAAAIARISCPIGLPQMSGKKPFEVAISAAAQLLQASVSPASTIR